MLFYTTQTKNYKLVQCKNGYSNGLRMSDLAGFYGWMSHLNNIDGIVYYTSKISQNILNLPPNNRIKYIKHPYQDLEIADNQNNQYIDKKPQKINLYDYQLEALKKLREHFVDNSRGILSLMCGMGKTLISYEFSKKYSKVIIISPIRQFVKQNLNRFKEYGCNKNYLTISCDGTRHIDTIKHFINSNNEFLISCTFISVDVLLDCIKDLDKSNLMIIIDEFHNLPKTSLTDETNHLYKLLHTDFNILFLSATPRIYELENNDEEQLDTASLKWVKLVQFVPF